MSEKRSALSAGLDFVREHVARVVGLSLLVTIPCIWHRHIEAGDLPSHTYNAWLADLLQHGAAPGLYTVWRWTNILFDFLLLYLGKGFGFFVGAKIVVMICVLIFFWGIFSLVAVASGRAPWFLAPTIAMLTFGYTFNMGFFNYYLSMGLACIGLALLWREEQRDWFAAAPILLLALFAHPLGPLWLVATIGYLLARKRLEGPWALILPLASIAAFVALHWYLTHIATFEVNWRDRPFYLFNGVDQLVVYGSRYRWVAIALLTIFLIWLLVELFDWKQHTLVRKPLSVLYELYFVAFWATALLPADVRFDPASSWLGLIVPRITVICAILSLCIIGTFRPRRWAFASLVICAVVFFAFLYQDTEPLNRLEAHVESITTKLPYGTHVVPVLEPNPDSRISFIEHVVDRACIAHCFVYSNYEPSSGQFRLRVLPGSPVAAGISDDTQQMEAGNYIVKPSDPPLKMIYQCSPADFTVVCVRDLKVGDSTAPPAAESLDSDSSTSK
ncbi:MAG: hypothetical protein M3N22_07300 [Acidobacteriota bacterium]|nr:hypothetical protein [Acidobacteriota bacterium]